MPCTLCFGGQARQHSGTGTVSVRVLRKEPCIFDRSPSMLPGQLPSNLLKDFSAAHPAPSHSTSSARRPSVW